MRGKNRGLQWAALLIVSAILALALTAARLPAALLLATIGAAALVASLDGQIRIAPRAFLFAQAIIGMMVARFIKADILHEIARDWPLYVAAALSVILTSCSIGWVLARWRVFPGSTAIWGSLPGGASAMVLMAEAYGADMRLVAFMQYFRVLMVALAASLVARFFAPGGVSAAPSWLTLAQAPIDWPAFGLTLLMLVASAWVGVRLRLPAGPLLLPLVAGAAAQDFGLMKIELPSALLVASYAVLGWSIGLRFSRDILLHALKSLPVVLGSNSVPAGALRRPWAAARPPRSCRCAERLSRHQPGRA